MSATLADRVCAWVADHPERTAEEIARAVGRNTAQVRAELRSGPYTVQPGPRGAWLYSLSDAVPARPAKPGRASGAHGPSQSEQLLGILADGGWHTTRELLQAVPCIVHSRVADLRRRGYQVEHDGHGGGSQNNRYRLVGSPLDPHPAPTAAAAGCGSSGAGRPPDGVPAQTVSTGLGVESGAAQLTLEGVAA